VLGDHADFVFCHQLLDRLARKGSINVQALGKDRWCDKLELRHLLVELVVCVLIKENEVGRLLARLSL
jgi:hypothetical protein